MSESMNGVLITADEQLGQRKRAGSKGGEVE